MIRLFLSVDIVGSTQFKAVTTTHGPAGWLDTFRNFFTNFPLVLAGQLGFVFLEEDETPAVEVWKAMGDEVIFTACPSSADEVVGILRGFLQTLRIYETSLFEKLPLRLKATAWLADFTENNIVLEIPELSSNASTHVDFIGPDVDLGFRLRKFAPPSCFVLSLDLVEVLLGARSLPAVAMYLVGREPLKGVMFGYPYPLIWMHDAEHGLDFFPWEIESCPLMTSAVDGQPASVDTLRRLIDDMRLYLLKMHGLERPPIGLG